MKYNQIITLKDGRKCCLRNGTEQDGQVAYDIFRLTHEQTDYLLSYPDENSFTAEQEGDYLKEKTESSNEIEILAEIDGVIAGLAGIEAIGNKEKVRHRADFGVSVDRKYWGLGIGTALLKACIACAEKAGFEQLELNVVADNQVAVAMYEKAGFVEFGRNPKGFKSRLTGDQEVILMRKEL